MVFINFPKFSHFGKFIQFGLARVKVLTTNKYDPRFFVHTGVSRYDRLDKDPRAQNFVFFGFPFFRFRMSPYSSL